MAKNKLSKRQHDTGRVVTTKTFFGSHREMLVDPKKFSLTLSEGEVLCKDDDGYYVTLESRLDTGLADPKRLNTEARAKLRSLINN